MKLRQLTAASVIAAVLVRPGAGSPAQSAEPPGAAYGAV